MLADNGRHDRFVVFRAGGLTWALSADGVREVLPTTQLTRPAGSATMLAGFMNVGGQPLAVVRLARLLGAEDNADDFYSHVLRISIGAPAAPIGFLVDRVLEVDAVGEGLAPLDESQSVNGAVVGNLIMGEQLVPLLDRGRLLLEEERVRLEELANAAKARLAELDQTIA